MPVDPATLSPETRAELCHVVVMARAFECCPTCGNTKIASHFCPGCEERYVTEEGAWHFADAIEREYPGIVRHVCPCHGDPCDADACDGSIERYKDVSTRRCCWKLIVEGHGMAEADRWREVVRNAEASI